MNYRNITRKELDICCFGIYKAYVSISDFTKTNLTRKFIDFWKTFTLFYMQEKIFNLQGRKMIDYRRKSKID